MIRMKKRTSHLDERGQLSIFLGISLLIIISLLAFIINVGLFVKAKINLQNSVDAAAWTGASVQAKQLTNIAYLNWELRNTYKEWMFKYYVLGQLSLPKTHVNNIVSPPNNYDGQTHPKFMNFRMNPFFREGTSYYNNTIADPYNLPSICLHFGNSSSNICEIYDVPGLPRFEPVGLPGATELHESFMDSLVEGKSKDCAIRTQLNMATAMIWAYGTKKPFFEDGTEVAAHRVGAWPQSIELALRIRNLEMIVNRPPARSPLCVTGSSCLQISELEQQNSGIPLHERPIKAFWSAFRNLGSELQQTFKLTELSPKPHQDTAGTLSNFLIPAGAQIGNTGIQANQKHYLDLHAHPLNLVTFFTSFVPKTGSELGGAVASEAQCSGSKTGLPVPGYIFEFVKNPAVVTYYAVKGSAKHVGLFFPFQETSGIEIKAYAAAKPFGGKVGPRLFQSGGTSPSTITPRTDYKRSYPYISGLKTPIHPNGVLFKPGDPIPFSQSFWINSNSNYIGGIPSGTNIKFAIPNLLYDFKSSVSELIDHSSGGDSLPIHKHFRETGGTEQSTRTNIIPQDSKGLYHKDQFLAFASNLEGLAGNFISAGSIDNSINNARRPTKYEARNYLIPTKVDIGSRLDTATTIPFATKEGPYLKYRIFAPLWGSQNTLYRTKEDIGGIIRQYIDQNQHAINQYTEALKQVSLQIVGNSPTATNPNSGETANTLYQKAANEIWMNPNAPVPDGCRSVAGRFHWFFLGQDLSHCGIIPLSFLITDYIENETATNPIFSKYYQSAYRIPDQSADMMMTGYMPGPRQGTNLDGVFIHPFLDLSSGHNLSKRNFYSTKLINIGKLINGGGAPFERSIYMEKDRLGNEGTNVMGISFINRLQTGNIQEFLGPIPYGSGAQTYFF